LLVTATVTTLMQRDVHFPADCLVSASKASHWHRLIVTGDHRNDLA
jgi:hypothetical protein